MRPLGLAAAALAAILATDAPALAKELCASHETVVAHLDEAYGERPTAVALASSGSILEVLVAADGGWTLIVTRPSGVTCIVEFGEGWQAVPPGSDEELS